VPRITEESRCHQQTNKTNRKQIANSHNTGAPKPFAEDHVSLGGTWRMHEPCSHVEKLRAPTTERMQN